MARNEHIRTWTQDGFTLHVYDTNKTDRHGKAILAYELYDQQAGAKPLFTGTNFHCSPLHPNDSDETLAAILGFLSVRPGDTEEEHFEHYSARQRGWCKRRGEELSFLAWELEQPYKPLEHRITHESWNKARRAGRLNRALKLHYEAAGIEHYLTLAAGYSDKISAYTQDDTVIVLTTNSRLGYVGLEAWHDGDKIDDLFFQNAGEELGQDIWELGDLELLAKLEPYRE